MPPLGFDRGKAHDRKGQDNQGNTGQGRPEASSSQIAHAQEKGGRKAFQRLISAGRMRFGPALKQNHFFFKPEKNDQGHHQGEPMMKKARITTMGCRPAGKPGAPGRSAK